MSAEANEAPVPVRLGPYVLGRRLGGGGMGDVYEATHLLMKSRRVAVKVLKPHMLGKPDRVQRFLREIEAIGTLKPHPNVVRAEFADMIDGSPFLVMEHIEGVDLGRLVQERGPMDAPEACACVLQAAEGLSAIHEAGLVHRDLKPSNLMMAPNGLVKILDLGLARLQFDDQNERTKAEELTSANAILGTLDFTAPEQLENPRGVDIRADIYSLGCTLYKLLSGKAPYAAFRAPPQKIRAHAVEPFPRLPESASHALQAVLDRLTAKNREERFQSPAEIVEALKPLCCSDGLEATASAAKKLYSIEIRPDPSRHEPPEPVAKTPLDASPTATYKGRPLERTRRGLPSRRMVSMAAASLGAVILAMLALFLRQAPTSFDVDDLEPMKWHPLFVREPSKLIWTKADRAGHTMYDRSMQHFFVTTHDRALFRIGETTRKNYKIQMTLSTAAWKRVGVFFAYRSRNPDATLPASEIAEFQYVSFGDADDPPKPILERGRIKVLRDNADGKITFSSSDPRIADLQERVGERVLEISVSIRNRVRVSLDNVLLEELNDVGNQPHDYRGAFGIAVTNNSCHFRDAKVYMFADQQE
jgi:serine/threonine protein kinase